MIWHIFKKDARLLWPIAALVALLQVCAPIPNVVIDHGFRTAQLAMLGELLSGLALLAIMVIVVLAMHQDPIPGARQDWLIRPIRRRNLALAKLLFVLLLVQAPLWIADFGAALADGFTLPAAGAAAAGRNMQIFCLFALPAMMLGAVTRTFVEALIVATVAWITFVGLGQVVISSLLGVTMTISDSGTDWMFIAAFDGLALIVAAAILAVQYSARRTVLAGCLAGAAGALLICVVYMPWRLAFGMQAALAPQPGAARAITMQFDPQAGRYRTPAGAAPSGASMVHLPLRVSDMPADSIVQTDWAQVRIKALNGAVLYAGQIHRQFDGHTMSDGRFEVRAGSHDGLTHSVDQSLLLPAEVQVRLTERQVRISIDYSFTLFGPAGTYSLPTTSARELLPGMGSCRTGIDAEGDDVSVVCLSTKPQPPCLSVYLEHPATRLKNPESHICNRDYAPALFAKFWPDTIHRMGGDVPFYDFSGLARFPVDGSKVATARVIIKTYTVRDHFTRHVDTPILRLADLTALAAPPPQ
jgi:hypothetical protein